jgi:hypothetical protein
VSDEVEAAIYRKQRSQTEGLAMWADLPMVPSESPTYRAEVKCPLPDVVWTETSHPDSVAGNSQNGRILAHLQTKGPLTSLDALTLFGCSRLAARIADLRSKGYAIRSRFVTVGANKRVSEYSLLDK